MHNVLRTVWWIASTMWMVDFIASAIYYARHIIGLTSSIPMVPKNVSLDFRKGDSENLIAYMGTFKKALFVPWGSHRIHKYIWNPQNYLLNDKYSSCINSMQYVFMTVYIWGFVKLLLLAWLTFKYFIVAFLRIRSSELFLWAVIKWFGKYIYKYIFFCKTSKCLKY